MDIGLADLKTVLISLVTGVVAFFLCVAIQRYWSNYSIKSMKRRIAVAEAEKATLDELAKSDRAIVVFGFQSIFALFALICIVFVIQTILLSPGQGDVSNIAALTIVLVWIMLILVSLSLALLIQKVGKYPKSSSKIEDKITRLKSKLLGLGDKK